MSFAWRMTGSAHLAAEIVQQTFLYLLQNLEAYRPQARFPNYLYRIARSLCLDEVRRGRLRRAVSFEAEPAVGNRLRSREAALDSRAEQGEELARVRRAVSSLPVHLREVLVMRVYEGLPYREISRILDCPESTATSRMDYALAHLRRALGAR